MVGEKGECRFVKDRSGLLEKPNASQPRVSRTWRGVRVVAHASVGMVLSWMTIWWWRRGRKFRAGGGPRDERTLMPTTCCHRPYLNLAPAPTKTPEKIISLQSANYPITQPANSYIPTNPCLIATITKPTLLLTSSFTNR